MPHKHMKKKHMKKLNVHPEIKSAVNSFFAGFIPVFIMNIENIDLTTLELSLFWGVTITAVRVAFKYGLAELFKWILKKLKLIQL